MAAAPPQFESQATYLDRHGLLTPAERTGLSESDFAPERVNHYDSRDDDGAVRRK